MNVLIAGAGIGGLTAALCLHANGINVRLFEAAPEIRPLGVGINVLSHAVAILDRLGVADAVVAAGVQTQALRFCNRHGQEIWTDPRGKFAGASHPQVSIHRGALQMALLNAARTRLGDQHIHTGATLVGFSQDEACVRIQLLLANGETETVQGDVLIGADGIHSVVRGYFYPDEGPPLWNGVMMARGTTMAPCFLDGATMIQAGYAGRKFVCYPVQNSVNGAPVLTNWVADLRAPDREAPGREHWNRPANLAYYLPHFADWRFDWLDVPAIMRGADAVYEFPMVDRDPIARWSFARVTLLGDAAHPMYPIGSNGATQAIVDADAVASMLTNATQFGESIENALRAYEAARAPTVARLIAMNREAGLDRLLDLAEQRAPSGFTDRDAVLPQREIDTIVNDYKRAAGYALAGAMTGAMTGSQR